MMTLSPTSSLVTAQAEVKAAIIFDVDGVLLELMPEEEELFFAPFAERFGLHELSRDWDSYEIRNEVEIIAEILRRHQLDPALQAEMITAYVDKLAHALRTGTLASRAIPGAKHLIAALAPHYPLALATANIAASAELRLGSASLWPLPAGTILAGADGGGHKSAILARAMAQLGLSGDRVIYIGDNLNDFAAATANNTHFIGFSTSPKRLQRLSKAGASHTAADHQTTLHLVNELLSLMRL